MSFGFERAAFTTAVPTSVTHSFSLSPRFLNDGTSSSAAYARPPVTTSIAASSIAARDSVIFIGLLLATCVRIHRVRIVASLLSDSRRAPPPPSKNPSSGLSRRYGGDVCFRPRRELDSRSSTPSYPVAANADRVGRLSRRR